MANKAAALMDSSFLSRVCRMVVVGNNDQCYQEIYRTLFDEGFEIIYARPDELSRALESDWLDVVVLDRTIPRRTAIALCRSIRSNQRAALVPILVMDDAPDHDELVESLRAGADDFLDLNMRRSVVAGRIKTQIRRRAACEELSQLREPLAEVIQVGRLTVKLAQYEVLIEGRPVHLSLGEFRLLALLASKPKHVFTRQQIVEALQGDIEESSGRALDSRIYSLRQKLGPFGHYVRTVRGVGFQLNAI